MSYSLAKLLACGSTAVLHGYTPQDVGEVKLDLEVSVVGDWKATEDSGAACTVYDASALLGCR